MLYGNTKEDVSVSFLNSRILIQKHKWYERQFLWDLKV
jgi:hypothetical protein